MTKHIFIQHHHEYYEYHGSTIVTRIKKAGNAVSRDWLLFDSVEEAQDFFNTNCEGY